MLPLAAAGCVSMRSTGSAQQIAPAYRDQQLGGGEVVIVVHPSVWEAAVDAAVLDTFRHALLSDLPAQIRNASSLDGARFAPPELDLDLERVERPLSGGPVELGLPREGKIVDLAGLSAPYVLFIHRIALAHDAPAQTLGATATWAFWDNRQGRLVAYGRAVTSAAAPDVRDAAEEVVVALAREMIKRGPFFPATRM